MKAAEEARLHDNYDILPDISKILSQPPEEIMKLWTDDKILMKLKN